MSKTLTFKQARAKMPGCVAGNFDPLAHTTIEDLAYGAEHELDLYYEGEYNDFRNNKRNVAAAESYVLLLTGKTYKERLQGLGK